jgi:hypothetical protein
MSGTTVGWATDDADARARLDARYGRRRPARGRKRVLVAVLALLVAAVTGWAVWAAFAVARSSLSWLDQGADAANPAAVRVSFAVTAAPGAHVVCTVRATDGGGVVVGWLDVPVTVPASGRTTATVVVPTSQPATGGGVAACALR